jgi:hypothetical protein
MPVDYDERDYECGYMWAAIEGGLRGEHSCIEVGEHDVHRCCCNAKTSRNTDPSSVPSRGGRGSGAVGAPD